MGTPFSKISHVETVRQLMAYHLLAKLGGYLQNSMNSRELVHPDLGFFHILDTDVLIIGSGIAGLRAALEVSRMGKRCLIVSKSGLGKTTNTYLAGGYFAFATENFDLDTHIQKTLKAGRKLNDRALVDEFIREAPALAMELREMGMVSALQSSGIMSRSRFLVGGPEIVHTLVRACRNTEVSFLEKVVVTDLLVRDGVCFGALGFHKTTGEKLAFRSRAVVMATGGAGAIYAQNDNAPGASGDGYAMCMKAGLELIDMEFVQFYPLVLGGSKKARMLIPALFADLGSIKNRLEEDLKLKYDLWERPLAIVGRDRLSRALFSEIALGNDIGGSLLLDLRGADIGPQFPFSDDIKHRLEKRLGYNSRPIPIMPASHHTMGGVRVNTSCETEVKRLFAAGEVVGGIHGANRMGGNALSESLVFGVLAARAAVRGGTFAPAADFEDMIQTTFREPYSALDADGPKAFMVPQLRQELAKVMWEKIGIIRREDSLREGLLAIDRIIEKLNGQRVSGPFQLSRLAECRSAAYTARAIAVSALERTESRGAHFREDFLEEREVWTRHIHVALSKNLPEVVRTSSVSDGPKSGT